jgi:hypothetical protein
MYVNVCTHTGSRYTHCVQGYGPGPGPGCNILHVRVLVQGNLHFNISGFNVFSNLIFIFSDTQPIISDVKFSTF